jgi:zinc finger protein
MSTEDKPNQQETVPESQFQKLGDLVERDDDTGVMQVESLCMNCHENVRLL